MNRVKKMIDTIIKYRYLIVIILFVICVLLKISFSSIDAWNVRIHENTQSKILGKVREIRSDEWLVQMPIFISQTENENYYAIYNDNYMQGNGNVLLMLLAPVWDITTISRPFVWGFLLFGAEYGFSWWWILRMLSLFMVSFEFVRIITKKDTLLTIAGTLMLALAPPMMWWFSTGVVDSYIFGIGIIVLFHYYMGNLDWKIWKKLLIAYGMIVCIPSFAFALYPAIQIPLAFIIAIFVINDFIKNFKKLKKMDYLIMGITLLITILLLVHFVIISWEDIKLMMGTVYPGQRFEVGGDYTIESFMKYFINFFLPYNDNPVIGNQCEQSAYIYPFVGLIILIIAYIKEIRDDKENKFLKLALIILFAVLLVWLFIGFNRILAKITLMYFSPTMRTQLVVGILGTILILMLLKNMEGKEIFAKSQLIIISLIISFFAYALVKQSIYNEYFTTKKLYILTLLAMIFAMTYSLLSLDKRKFAIVMCIVSIFAGIHINPIIRGIDVFNKTEISRQIHLIEEKDKNQLWIGEGDTEAQYLLGNGIKTLNGTNYYPNFSWLNLIDEEGEFNNIYNRYAHISIKLGNVTNFKLLAQDSYEAELTYENIKNLGIKYYFTLQECPEETKNQFNLESVYENKEKNQYIYQFN